MKGRIVTLEFDTTYVVGTYVVNAGNKLKVRIVVEYVNIWADPLVDFGREENVERTFHKLYPRPRQEETGHLDGRSQCCSYCTGYISYSLPIIPAL